MRARLLAVVVGITGVADATGITLLANWAEVRGRGKERKRRRKESWSLNFFLKRERACSLIVDGYAGWNKQQVAAASVSINQPPFESYDNEIRVKKSRRCYKQGR